MSEDKPRNIGIIGHVDHGKTTLAALIARLHESAKEEMTPEEVAKQKASFVYGQLPPDHPMSKEDVENYLAGKKVSNP
ncbi:MAG TPA: hypothetical protein DD397_06810 [Hyphomonas sp.]|uniref:GTP-binding protein n=1 Tax=Hyphomonas sp. TaxID=87 RepID=UPI000E85D13F|nr:GTP-binding protein [Hyphomonas sp.]QDP49072.1 MAG: hypothetical protein Unbinned4811contig1001_17 [Prokaryotic dsDNA virus sp.]HBN92256.1 hypothetical protein [Hyphomonas sp.]